MMVPKSFCDRLRQPDNEAASVCRYMSLSKFVWMLSKKQLWFSPLSILEDKFEGAVPKPMLDRAEAFFRKRGYPESHFSGHLDELRKLKRRFYVSCWQLAERESRTMWNKYCGSQNGIRVKTNYAKLRKSLEGFPIGLVEYIDFDAFEDPAYEFRPLHSAWLKRPEFAEDNEIRVGYLSDWVTGWPPDDGSKTPIGAPIDWDPEPVIERISVYPGASYSDVEAVQAVLEQWAPSIARLVAWSEFGSQRYQPVPKTPVSLARNAIARTLLIRLTNKRFHL